MARPATKKKAKPKVSQTLSQRVLRWVFRPKRLVVVSTLALLWLFWPQVRQELPTIADREEYLVGPAQVTITPLPRWVPSDLVEQVFHRAELDKPLSLLDEQLSERIAVAFYTHPWIEDVHRVSKVFPARVQVEVTYRQPVAMVKGIDGHYAIDRHGYLLPPRDFSLADVEQYPVIHQISSTPKGGPGEPWGDPAATGAAQLAAILLQTNEAGQTWWEALDLQAILAPGRLTPNADPADLEFQIATPGGSRIRWGRAPDTKHPAELTVAQKLQRMVDYHRDFGSFDDGPAPQAIDIRHWQATRRSLLATEDREASRQ
jgi:hypothetical protein